MSRVTPIDRDIVRLVRAVQTEGSTFTVPKDIATLANVPERVSEQRDSVTCDECGYVRAWREAYFLPFATLCEAGGPCEAKAREREAARDE